VTWLKALNNPKLPTSLPVKIWLKALRIANCFLLPIVADPVAEAINGLLPLDDKAACKGLPMVTPGKALGKPLAQTKSVPWRLAISEYTAP
jgi:hypothetical protein